MTFSGKSYSLLILAGGRGSRMGGQDKGLVHWRGRPLIEYAIDGFAGQTSDVMISCNRHIEEYAKYGRTLRDTLPDFQGPLAGIYRGLAAAKSDTVLILPCDCPSPPTDLYERLYEGLSNSPHPVCCASDGEHDQYLFALIKPSNLNSLSGFLEAGGRSVKGWYAQCGYTVVDFSDKAQAFANINTLEADNKP